MVTSRPNFAKSWWLKLDRAQQHLAEIQGILARMSDPYLTHVGVNKQPQGDVWVYSVNAEIEIPRMLRPMIGDFMFNLRSALDHIVAANPAVGKSGYGQFPIFAVDVSVPNSPESQAHPKWYRGLKKARENIDPAVFAVIECAQPYNTARIGNTDPENDVLSIFNTLHNADKHKSLSIVATGIRDFKTFISTDTGDDVVFDGPAMPLNMMLPNGASVFTHEFERDVQLVGTVLVAIRGEPNGTYQPIPDAFEGMYVTVRALLLKITAAM